LLKSMIPKKIGENMNTENSSKNQNLWIITYPYGQESKISHQHLKENPNFNEDCAIGRFFNENAEFTTENYAYKKELSTWKKNDVFSCHVCNQTSNLWEYTWIARDRFFRTTESSRRVICHEHLMNGSVEIKKIGTNGKKPLISYSANSYGIAPLEETWNL